MLLIDNTNLTIFGVFLLDNRLEFDLSHNVRPIWISYLFNINLHYHLVSEVKVVLLPELHSIIWYHFKLIDTLITFAEKLMENEQSGLVKKKYFAKNTLKKESKFKKYL